MCAAFGLTGRLSKQRRSQVRVLVRSLATILFFWLLSLLMEFRDLVSFVIGACSLFWEGRLCGASG